MAWPEGDTWYALKDGLRIPSESGTICLKVVDCGFLKAPTGRLVACDPFADMHESGKNPFVTIPPGIYPVKVTLADVSGLEDGSHYREAYASLLISGEPEHSRRCMTPLCDGESAPEMAENEFLGFPVDAGTACFVDDGALRYGMPPVDEWSEVFDHSRPVNWFQRAREWIFDYRQSGSWFNLMDDPKHIRAGLANIRLPLAKDGSNIVIFHSGWGDGSYPVVGGYDREGRLVRVHIDFQVVGPSE